MAQVEVWMSLAAWSVAEQRNAGSFELYPVYCSAIVRSIPAPHSAPRRQSQQNHLWKIKWSFALFFRSPLSLDALFFFHSLTLRSITPFLCRGVVFRSPPATRGRPRWPTEGGREGGTERLLLTKDRLWPRTIFRSLRTPSAQLLFIITMS